MTNPDPNLYRPCAGLMIANAQRQVFVGKRLDTKEGDWWQMPQGGIDPGEDADEGAFRELREETGLTQKAVTIIARSQDELYYDLPDELKGKLWGGKYIGQRQRWFLMRYEGDGSDIDLESHDPAEFGEYRWIDPDMLPDLIIPFKRPVYRAVLKEFGPLI